MPEEKFSAEDSLKLISNMIGQAKARFSENGHLYLLWGRTVFVCSVGQSILLKFVKFEQHYRSSRVIYAHQIPKITVTHGL